MEKNEKNILQFEADDTSEMGINGKQVFFTKRINGKTTHYKAEPEDESKNRLKNIEKDKKEELFIEVNVSQSKQEQQPLKKDMATRKKKKRKKRKRKTRALKIIMLLVLVGSVIVFALVSPIFNISKIEVEGNDKINSQEIITLSGIKIGTNIFRNSSKNIESKIKENSYVNSINIKRRLPGTIVISVKERTPEYQIKVINSYVYIDYQGYILEVSATKADVPMVEGLITEQDTLLNGKRLVNEDIIILRDFIKIMNEAKKLDVAKLINTIKIENNEYKLQLKDNKIVNLGNNSGIRKKMEYLISILNGDKEIQEKNGTIYINGDLNDGFKPYFREQNIQQNESN